MVKKSAKKTAGNKGTKKSVKKAAPKAKGKSKQGAKKREGLRKPQIRVLQALAKNKRPLTREQIAEKAPCDLAMLNSYLGAHRDEIRLANDKKNFPCLVTLKMVKVELQEDGPSIHTITALGKTALAAAK